MAGRQEIEVRRSNRSEHPWEQKQKQKVCKTTAEEKRGVRADSASLLFLFVFIWRVRIGDRGEGERSK